LVGLVCNDGGGRFTPVGFSFIPLQLPVSPTAWPRCPCRKSATFRWPLDHDENSPEAFLLQFSVPPNLALRDT